MALDADAPEWLRELKNADSELWLLVSLSPGFKRVNKGRYRSFNRLNGFPIVKLVLM